MTHEENVRKKVCAWSKQDYWLVWHKCQRAYAIMDCSSCVVVLHRQCVWWTALPSTRLIIEFLNFTHVCSCASSLGLPKIGYPDLHFWNDSQVCYYLYMPLLHTKLLLDFIIGTVMHLYRGHTEREKIMLLWSILWIFFHFSHSEFCTFLIDMHLYVKIHITMASLCCLYFVLYSFVIDAKWVQVPMDLLFCTVYMV